LLLLLSAGGFRVELLPVALPLSLTGGELLLLLLLIFSAGAEGVAVS